MIKRIALILSQLQRGIIRVTFLSARIDSCVHFEVRIWWGCEKSGVFSGDALNRVDPPIVVGAGT